jgi:hypothetical protein
LTRLALICITLIVIIRTEQRREGVKKATFFHRSSLLLLAVCAIFTCNSSGKLLQLPRISENIFFLRASALIFALPKTKGSLAQLVQSICLTSRGSAVRTRQLPLNTEGFQAIETLFYSSKSFGLSRKCNQRYLCHLV